MITRIMIVVNVVAADDDAADNLDNHNGRDNAEDVDEYFDNNNGCDDDYNVDYLDKS